MTQQVKCPRCKSRICDRTPEGYAAGHFRCRSCKLEVIITYSALSESMLIVVPLTETAVREIPRCLPDGRGLVTWDEYLALWP